MGVEHAPSHTQPDGPCPMRFPSYAPIAAPLPPDKPAVRPQQQRPQLDRALWPAIAERARCESLRDLAADYGVSHETIRAIVRRVGRPVLVGAAADCAPHSRRVER